MVVVRELQHETTHFGSPSGANQCEMSGSGGRMSHTSDQNPSRTVNTSPQQRLHLRALHKPQPK